MYFYFVFIDELKLWLVELHFNRENIWNKIQWWKFNKTILKNGLHNHHTISDNGFEIESYTGIVLINKCKYTNQKQTPDK